MQLYDKTDPKSIEAYSLKLTGHAFAEAGKWYEQSNPGEIIDYGKESGKGKQGNFIEKYYFMYKNNSESRPDFPEAGVELKVTPYKVKKNGGVSAAERLSLTMINYGEPVEPELEESHLWAKCKLLLILFYLREHQSWMYDSINYAKLFTPTGKDLEIIRQDYTIIITKIKEGRAEQLSEADTLYLGASTKGDAKTKNAVQELYAPQKTARRRAFCYKQSYMTYVLNSYVVNVPHRAEEIIHSPLELQGRSFEQIISDKVNQYVGKTDKELCEIFDVKYTRNKSQWSTLAFRMLGVKSNKAEEFEKANIVIKTVRIKKNGVLAEDVSLPAISFADLINETWEDSFIYNYLYATKFLFVVFQEKDDEKYLKGCKLWNMPYDDLNNDVYVVWDNAQDTLKKGVVLTKKMQGGKPYVDNNFPKSKENPVSFLRNHTGLTYYDLGDGEIIGTGKISNSDVLPDGRRMTKQSFWLNKHYVKNFLDNSV